MVLLGSNKKIIESNKNVAYQSYILHLMPNTTFNNKKNLCPKATEGCKKACLFYSSRGTFPAVKKARYEKTKLFIENKNVFMTLLAIEIEKARAKAIKQGKKLVIRLNGTSDIAFENIKVMDGKNIFEMFPDVIFYDYTKVASRLNKKLPENYSLIFSYSGESDYYENVNEIAQSYMAAGGRVAVVFGNGLPDTFLDYPVVDGTKDDLVFLKPQSVVIGLKPVGLYGKKDNTGFVVYL